MAGREFGVARKRLSGEAAAPYLGIARTQLGILKNLMSFQELKQLSRTVELSDGTRIFVQSIFGQDTIRIDAPEIAPRRAGEEAAVISAVNRVAEYVGVMMPNPVPYRGLNTGEAITGGTTSTYIMTSDGVVLASEVQIRTPAGSYTHIQYSTMFGNPPLGYEKYAWSGGDSLWMFEGVLGGWLFNHKLSFTVPEDCVYPAPSPTPYLYSSFSSDGNDAAWNADWAAGVAAFNARRKAWFLKNSNEFMAALKGKFQPGAAGVTRAELQTGALPASWDYQIKSQYGSRAGRHTKMPIIMNVTYVDTVLSDTSTGLSQAGTMVTQRAATFQYVDANGTNQTATVNGTLTQVIPVRSDTATPHYNTYLNWYAVTTPVDGASLLRRPQRYQFIQDLSITPLGLIFNGTEIAPNVSGGFPNLADSTYGNPTSAIDVLTTFPAGGWPAYSNTLVGTAAPLYLQYHNTVLPQYVADTAQSSAVMNNSAMYHVKQIELCLFGPAPNDPTTHLPTAIGIFPDPTDADGATNIAYYGEASFQFDWTTGAITMLGWSPRKDTNGNDAPTIVPMPAGYSYKNQAGTLYFNNGAANYTQAYNCTIGYVWDSPDQMWPDVAEYLRKKIAQLLAGGGDQMLYTVIKQALAL